MENRECPEWCDHLAECADARKAIIEAETEAESAWLRAAEAGYPGYDYDPYDPESTDR